MKRFPLADFELSALAYGLMRTHEADEDLRDRLETCLSVGITTLDHADIYGAYGNEALLGDVFRADPAFREQFEIITKCGIQSPRGERADLAVKHYDTSAGYIRAQVERSCDKLATDRIDLLLIHRPDPLMDHRETGWALDQLVAAGTVRAVGVSNFRPWDVSLLQSAMETPLLVNQIELSLAHLAPFTNGDLAFCQEHDVRVMAWSALGGGKLPDHPKFAEMAAAKDATIGQIALAFLMAHPAGIIPVIGTNRAVRIEEAARAAEIELSRTDWFQLYEAASGQPVP